MAYKSVKHFAEKWGLTERRVRVLCQQGRIEGAFKQGRKYLIPEDAKKPEDRRSRPDYSIPKGYVELIRRIDEKKWLLTIGAH